MGFIADGKIFRARIAPERLSCPSQDPDPHGPYSVKIYGESQAGIGIIVPIQVSVPIRIIGPVFFTGIQYTVAIDILIVQLAVAIIVKRIGKAEGMDVFR